MEALTLKDIIYLLPIILILLLIANLTASSRLEKMRVKEKTKSDFNTNEISSNELIIGGTFSGKMHGNNYLKEDTNAKTKLGHIFTVESLDVYYIQDIEIFEEIIGINLDNYSRHALITLTDEQIDELIKRKAFSFDGTEIE